MPVIARMWEVVIGKLRASMEAQLSVREKNEQVSTRMLTLSGQVSKCGQVCNALGRKMGGPGKKASVPVIARL